MRVCIVYASTTGNTAYVAQQLSDIFENASVVLPLAELSQTDIDACDLLLCCVSTWGNGLMQDDWHADRERFASFTFTGKNCAVCGLGDQRLYPDHFADGAGILADLLRSRGAVLLGKTSTNGYDFDDSIALEGRDFIACILDEDNQHPQTEERLVNWVKQLKRELTQRVGRSHAHHTQRQS